MTPHCTLVVVNVAGVKNCEISDKKLLLSETKRAAGDHNRDDPSGIVQSQGLGESKEYVHSKKRFFSPFFRY